MAVRRAVTMRDVAERAGVDPSVVSRLLNEDPRLSISPQTRERVLKAIEELDYRPNLAARALRTSRTGLVAVMLPDLSNPVYAQLLDAIHARASAAGYGIVHAQTHQVMDQSADVSDLLRRVDGLLVAAGTFPRDLMRRLSALPIPTVVMNRATRSVACSIVIDDRAGSALVAEHLLELGHRSFAVLIGSNNDGVGTARLRAFSSAVEPAGATVTPIIAEGFSARDGYEATRSFLRTEVGATAMFAVNFMLGIGALRSAHDLGVDVPSALSVAALHESELAAFMTPSLTTVQMPMAEVGGTAFDELLALLKGADGGTRRIKTIRTPPRLLARESTGPAPS